ncbi:MAG: ribosome biogenesis GTPase YlqF [Clostridiales bacterium]|nr:ribosome biogenesis GTPase YlqF [Clostridiales bacterium]
MNVNWYPGHMAKTFRVLNDDLKGTDIVIQLRDARVPRSSINPKFEKLFGKKINIILLSKADLADPDDTAKWIRQLKAEGAELVMPVNASDPQSVKQVKKLILSKAGEIRRRTLEKRGMNVTVRAIVAGIPNSGKSTFINNFFGKARTKTGNKPGVTKDNQWVKESPDFEIMDTPGLLWPDLENEITMLNLMVTNAIKNELYDTVTLASTFLVKYKDTLCEGVLARYGVDIREYELGEQMIEAVCEKKSMKMKGGVNDVDRCAEMIINDFRAGKLGRITLEKTQE